MSTHYEIVYRGDGAETWSRTTFRFASVSDAAQFCATTGDKFFIVAVDEGCERALNQEEEKELQHWAGQ